MVSIDRPHNHRIVKWRNAEESEPVELTPGAAWKLYVPSTYTGATLDIQVWVRRKVDDAVTDEGPIEDWKTYDQGSVTFNADEVVDLTPNALFGIRKVRFVSDLVENCTGELQMSS